MCGTTCLLRAAVAAGADHGNAHSDNGKAKPRTPTGGFLNAFRSNADPDLRSTLMQHPAVMHMRVALTRDGVGAQTVLLIRWGWGEQR